MKTYESLTIVERRSYEEQQMLAKQKQQALRNRYIVLLSRHAFRMQEAIETHKPEEKAKAERMVKEYQRKIHKLGPI